MPKADRTPFLGVAEDGKAEYNFHQSWLEDFVLCGERARTKMMGEVEEGPKPEADLGTALHAGIEYILTNEAGWMEGYQVALDAWEGFDHELSFEKGDAYLWASMQTFEREVVDTLDPLAVEMPFRRLPFYEDDRKRIFVSGTLDYVDATLGPIDWKTSGRPYKAWEKQRWNGQASLYTWALRELGVFENLPMPFTFYVFVKPHGTLQRIRVLRDEGQWDWMRLRCRNAVTLLEAELEHWPVNDQHALCSAKFCPAWGVCKGAFVNEGWEQGGKELR